MDNILEQLGITNTSTDFDKQDILQLLQIGLKENQSFAKYFADTILVELQRKFQNIKIQSSAIEIDGKSISKEINDNIRVGLEKDIDKTVKNIRKEIADIGKGMSVDAKKNTLSIDSILGQTTESNFQSRQRFQGLTKILLDKIEKGIPSEIDFKTNGISLGQIFQPPGKVGQFLSFSRSRYMKWSNIQDKILNALNTSVSSLSEKGFNLKNGMSLGQIFQPPGKVGQFLSFSYSRYVNWGKLQDKILDAIDKGIPDKKGFNFKDGMSLGQIFQPPGKVGQFLSFSRSRYINWGKLQDKILEAINKGISKGFTFKQKISLNDIMGVPPEASFLTRRSWSKLQRNILNSISKSIEGKILFKGPLSLNDIMGVPPEASFLTRRSWSKLQRNILDKITKYINQNKQTDADDKKISSHNKEGFRSLEEKEPNVKVSGFTNSALKDLSRLPGMDKVSKIETKKENDKKGAGLGILATLGLVGVGLLGGGLLSSIISIFNDGPFKGLQKAVGNIMANIGKMLTKTFLPQLEKRLVNIFKGALKGLSSLVGIFSKGAAKSVTSIGRGAIAGLIKTGGTFLKGIMKKLPIIGTVISIGSAISRIIKGDFIGGMLDVASGIASLIPGAGTAIAIAIDLFNAGRDIKTGGAKKAGQSGINKNIGKFLTEKLEDIPIIGNFIKISKALGALSAGNWKMAGLYLTGAIPGLGWIFDKETLDKSAKNAPTKSFSQLVRDAVKDKIKNILKGLPGFVKNPIYKMMGISEETEKRDDSIIQKVNESEKKKDTESEFKKVQAEQKEYLSKLKEAAKKANLPVTNNLSGKVEAGNKKIVTEITSGDKTANMESLGLLTKEEQEDVNESRRLKTQTYKDIKSTNKELNLLRKDMSNINDINISKKDDNQKEFLDTIIPKNDKNFEKLLTAVKEQKGHNTESLNQLKNEMHQLIKKMDGVMNTIVTNLQPSKHNMTPAMEGTLGGISGNAGETRDPAYILRSRAWDRIRKGYVVI
ncbi:MAG: hypothetical protein PHS54_00555 [Clostridia bacterium]|nr:hypothetical protein [Clostridia bacterium]